MAPGYDFGPGPARPARRRRRRRWGSTAPTHLALYAPPEQRMAKQRARVHKRTLSIERAQIPAWRGKPWKGERMRKRKQGGSGGGERIRQRAVGLNTAASGGRLGATRKGAGAGGSVRQGGVREARGGRRRDGGRRGWEEDAEGEENREWKVAEARVGAGEEATKLGLKEKRGRITHLALAPEYPSQQCSSTLFAHAQPSAILDRCSPCENTRASVKERRAAEGGREDTPAFPHRVVPDERAGGERLERYRAIKAQVGAAHRRTAGPPPARRTAVVVGDVRASVSILGRVGGCCTRMAPLLLNGIRRRRTPRIRTPRVQIRDVAADAALRWRMTVERALAGKRTAQIACARTIEMRLWTACELADTNERDGRSLQGKSKKGK
ncbi:hypothetical protein DFH09DRAFT_1106219 [Mycena vulgaris]|nr:hypothetical protein DFH09DRAFT_1106219 [Mycena vulgaris]